MASIRPTDLAKNHFNEARRAGERANRAIREVSPGGSLNKQEAAIADIARGVEELGWGLYRLAEGIRATYILLEEVRRGQAGP
jgi:hypothetical protein